MKRKNTLWQKIVFLEEQLTEEEQEECRKRASDRTPVVNGFRETNVYNQNYIKELNRAYRGKEREDD